MKKSSLFVPSLMLVLAGCSDEPAGGVYTNDCFPGCNADEVCSAGVCIKQEAPACGSHQELVNGECVDIEQCSPKCGAGEVCKSGICEPLTTEDCNPECGSGYVCVKGECVPDTHDCDPACGEGYVCRNGECVPNSNVGSQCNPGCYMGEECIEGRCVTTASKCNPECENNQMCISGVCVDGATCVPECDETSVCLNGACVKASKEGCGTTTASCDSGICLNGKCVLDTTCKPDCQKGQVCINGACVSGDGSDCKNCGDDQICVQGICISGNSCSPACGTHEVCVNGKCLERGENDCYPPCSEYTACANGVCVATNECIPSCRAGYACFNGVCLSSDGECQVSCADGFACFGVDEKGSSLCLPSTTCNPKCGSNEICVNGTCVSGQTNDCDPACGENEVCVKGQCIPGKSCDPACSGKQICIDGVCVNSDNCNPPCGFEEVCVNNVCVLGGNERCNPECKANETCYNGQCIVTTTTSCSCEGSRVCVDNKCVQADDGTCNPRCPEGRVCVNGSCQELDDGTCNPECTGDKICRNGECVYGDDGSCRPECKEGFLCQNGSCVAECKTAEGVRCGSLCCEGNTPICDEVENVCLAQCGANETRCGDEFCCDNAKEFCIYGECKLKETHHECESAKDCALDAFCEATVKMCISEDDVPSDCKRSTQTYPFDAALLWNWPKDLTNGAAAGKSNWFDSVDSYNVMATPIVINLTDDNGDGLINENDIPEVVFPTFRTRSIVKVANGSSNACYNGVSSVRAVTTTPEGKLIELAASDELYHGEEDLGAADIDGDGVPEVIAGSPSELHALRLVKDASAKTGYRWDTVYKQALNAANGNTSYRVAASFADLEGDGIVDIITNYGVSVVVGGKMQWKKMEDGKDCKINFGSHTAADLDGDGKLEIIGGGSIFDSNCKKLINTNVLGGYVSVADLLESSKDANETGELVPEIATVSGSSFHFFKIFKKDGVWSVKETWKHALPVNKKHPHYISQCPNGGTGGHCDAAGGPPVIADFNGDTIPDVGVATRYYYIVYSNDGTPTGGKVLWADSGTQDFSSAVTGSSVFDFQGDGVAEILYADEINLYVYNGTGTTTDADKDGFNDPSFIIGRTEDAALKYVHSSGTAYEYPIVVDMDNDGKSEIIHASNYYSSLVNAMSKTKSTGVSVYKDTQNRWVRTRRIWNQHDYHVTNINEDGTVPLLEAQNWTMKNLNNFRQNVQPSAINAAPNLLPKVLSYGIGKCPESVTLVARFMNNGGLGTSEKIVVTFYARDASNNDIVIGKVEHNNVTIPGTPITILFDWNFKSLDGKVEFNPNKQTQIYYSIDTPDSQHADGLVIECREDDNVSDMLSVSCPANAIN